MLHNHDFELGLSSDEVALGREEPAPRWFAPLLVAVAGFYLSALLAALGVSAHLLGA